MRLEGARAAVIGGHRRACRGVGAGGAPGARRGLRAGAGAGRGGGGHPDRLQRRGGPRGPGGCATPPNGRQACPRRWSLRDGASGRMVARLPLGAGLRRALRAALPARPPRRPAGRAGARGGGQGIEVRLDAPAAPLAPAADGVWVRSGRGRERFDLAVAADGVRSAQPCARCSRRGARASPAMSRGARLVHGGRGAGAIGATAHRLFMGQGRHVVAYPLRAAPRSERRRGRGTRGLGRRRLDASRRSVRAAHRLRRRGAGTRGAPGGDAGELPLGPLRPSALRAGRRPGARCWATPPTRCCPSSPRARPWRWRMPGSLPAELDDRGVPAALAAYEAPRMPRPPASSAPRAQRAHLPPAPGPLRAARDAGLRTVSRLAPGGLLGRFDWLYGGDVVSARATV